MIAISVPKYLESHLAHVIRKELAWHDARTAYEREWMFGSPTAPVTEERGVVLIGVTEDQAAALDNATSALAESST